MTVDTKATLCIAAALLLAAVASASDLPDGAVRVQQARIVDQYGFERPMVAATMMIPAGWKEQGGISWQMNNSGCGPRTPHVSWSATAPDGVSALQLLPEESWSGHNMMYPGMPATQCPNVTITDMQQFVVNYAQRHRPNTEIVDYRQRQDLVQQVQQYLPPQQPMYGMETNQWVGAGEVILRYQHAGQTVRELLGVLAVFTHTRMSDGMGGVTETLSIATVPGYAYRAPDKELDLERVETIRRSFRTHPNWQARMNQHHAKIARINAQGAADRARITAQANEEIRRMNQESWETYNASMDRNSREFAEYIRDTETYDSPSGGTVQLDNTYEHAWELDDGSYVLTNDSSFNPGSDLGLSGSKLQKTR